MMSIPRGLLFPNGESAEQLPVTAQVPGHGFLIQQNLYDHTPHAPVTNETGFYEPVPQPILGARSGKYPPRQQHANGPHSHILVIDLAGFKNQDPGQ
jgi:hypothetical protein